MWLGITAIDLVFHLISPEQPLSRNSNLHLAKSWFDIATRALFIAAVVAVLSLLIKKKEFDA
jgi:hypothetical protein